MPEQQDEAKAAENPAPSHNAAQQAKEEELKAVHQAQQAKDRGAKEQPNNGSQGNGGQRLPPMGSNGELGSRVENMVGGDHMSVHQGTQNIYNYIIQASHGGSGSFDDRFSKFTNDPDPFNNAYGDRARATKRDAPLTNKDADTPGTEVKLPETVEAIEDWYCEQLTDEWEICFVQAAAVLHGAPVPQIRAAANTLYHHPVVSAEHPVASIPKISEKRLRTYLYMEIVHTQGADRLFWLDANTSGLSTIAMRLLPIIVRQSNLSATHPQGQDFLSQLEKWSMTLSGECAWRATRALGGLWIKSEEDQFLHIVNEWANSDDPNDWRRAATLLDGAYEVEYAEQDEQVNEGNNSYVLELLERWTRHAHASFQENIGSTVAQAYGRIGQRSLAPALKGLEALLRYPLRRKNDTQIQMPLVVFVAATWSYTTLARFGYAREVLHYIASLVERCCYQRRSPQGKERTLYRAQCRFLLYTMFHTFLLIALASLNGVRNNVRGNYTREESLPQHPFLPSDKGQDVLLAGILSSEETEWRQDIITILCGAILEKDEKPAFYLIQTWAEITLQEPGPQRPLLREAFLGFLLELASRGNQWCRHLASIDEYDFPDIFALHFAEALQQWQVKQSGVPPRPLRAFARDVSDQLP